MISNERSDAMESRLPTDPSYWTGLSNKIVADAAPLLEEYRTWRPWWLPIARFGPSLSLASAAAVAAVWFITPVGAGAPNTVSQFEYALAPPDPVARTFVLSAAPPDISILLPLHQEGL